MDGSGEITEFRAAQYVRMSTEHQQYSTHNQSDKIREYAEKRGIEIIKTYADDGKSGLSIGGRAALQQLIADVESGAADFNVILVYDVSRWGRFQDADESAYYEYICKRAGINVAYCAEQFENDGSPVSTIVKGVKRAMAGEYSRELSVKVFAGQCRLIELGFRQGGAAGFGLRRVLVNERGEIKGELKRGEHKSLQTDRVILMPGPDEEVAWVNKMYRWLIEEDLSFREIADRLNEEGVTTDLDRPWNSGTVRTVLTNEKYIGNNVYNRSSFKLKKLHVENPPDMWVRKEGAFEGIVPLEFFLTAQEIITARSARLSDEELLDHLKRLYADAGQLSGVLIDQTPDMPSSSAYRNRFGSLSRAYEMIGYRSDRDQERIALNKRLRGMHPEIIARTEAAIAEVGGTVARDTKTDLLTINDEMVVSLVLARCQPMGDGFLMLAASLAMFDDTTPMPSVYGLVPVLGTALIILFASPSTWVGRVLSLKPVVFIGLISYSTYLWHQPLLAFARMRAIPSASELILALAVIASFVLGYLSWRYVEQPFRKGGPLFSIPRARILGGSVAALGGLAVIGLIGNLQAGFPGRLTERAVTLAAFAHDKSPLENEDNCTFYTTRQLTEQPISECDMFMRDGRADVIFIGDSHSGAISYDTQIALGEIGISSYGITYSGCLGLRGFERLGQPEGYDCLGYNELMIEFARESGAKVLVITGRFPLYLTGERFDNGEGGIEHGPAVHFDRTGVNAGTTRLDDPARIDRMLSGFTEELERLTSEFSVVFVEPIPEAGWEVPQLAARIAFFRSEDVFDVSTDRAAYEQRVAALNTAIDQVQSDRLFRVGPDEVFCNRVEDGRCINADQNVAYYFDNNHLSRSGARELAPAIVAAIQAGLEYRRAEIVRP